MNRIKHKSTSATSPPHGGRQSQPVNLFQFILAFIPLPRDGNRCQVNSKIVLVNTKDLNPKVRVKKIFHFWVLDTPPRRG